MASGWLALACAASSAAADDAPAADGFHATPQLGFRHGDHHAELRVDFRYRWEDWKAFASEWDAFHALRTRISLDYRFKEVFRFFAQGQQTAVLELGSGASGAGGLYRSNNGGDKHPASVRPNQLFAEFRPSSESWVRLGRSTIDMGTLIDYEEKNWSFLKRKRLSQRLVGSVGWSHSARSYDGISALFSWEGHRFHLFAAEPTTGVFVVDGDAYKRQKKLLFGGIDWTAERGTLFEDSEIGAFFIAYTDHRNPAKVAGYFGDIEVYTLGGSWLGVYPLGPGRVDALLWGAFQFGDYADVGPATPAKNRDQLAGALIAEVGYQLPDVWSQPWLRFGVNWGSGDSDLDDSDRNTFFNILPTNHLYYGYADQFALQNLIDLLVQLKLAPIGKLAVELSYHRFWLQEDSDFRWSGTGAFSRQNLGFVRNGQNGSSDLGHELDLVMSLPLQHGVVVSGGISRLWGGDAFDAGPRQNATFGFVQVAFHY